MKSATAILQKRRGSCQGCGTETAQTTPDGRLFQCEACEACVPVPLKSAPHDSTERITPRGRP